MYYYLVMFETLYRKDPASADTSINIKILEDISVHFNQNSKSASVLLANPKPNGPV